VRIWESVPVRGRTLDHNELERTFKQIQASLELSYV
jgi:hypothetical protein